MKRVCWLLSEYVSHRRAGEAYRRCLPLAGFESVDRPESADVVVVHEDPIFWPRLFDRYPVLRDKIVVGYAVWEGEALPEVYRPGLGMVREVWTASTFSAQALGQGHPRVRVLPHVVEPVQPEPGDVAWVQELVGEKPYFFSVVDAVNPRKNLEALLRVFARVRAVCGADTHLVLKQYRKAIALDGISGVIALAGDLSDARMAALHQGSLAYVSPHRGEAWGLALSEAMSHGIPVLATGWSGNMDFMDSRNSVPLDYALEPVGSRMSGLLPHFRPDMRWAAVDEAHLEREMLRLVRRGPDPAMCQRARSVADRFSPARVARTLGVLLREFF